jgi:hypothetical protein
MNPALWLIETVIVTVAGVWQGIRQDLNLLEVAAIAVGLYAWKRGWRPKNLPALRAFPKPDLIAAGIVAAAIVLRLALIPVLPVPIPFINDEFSHLLLADTLMHGRVANPTPRFWEHFESLHIIQQPHYVSNYFPGHALFLAAGRIALGHPWAGILAEYALFLAALYWALRGWMPSRWALFGMVLAVVRFGIGSYWINAYHAGFIASIGGALVFGAFARLRASRSRQNATSDVMLGLAFGWGLAILASTRPFEGLFFALPFAAVLMWEMRTSLGRLLRVTLAAAVIVLPAMAALGIYFEHITGSPFVTAYQISQKTYGWPMGLAWRTPPKIQNRHPEMQNYYDYEIGEHEKVGSVGGFIEFLTFRLQEYWRFFFGPLLTIPLLMLGRVGKRRPMLLAGAAGGIVAILAEGAASPHYLAPAAVVFVAVVVEGCRYFDGLRLRVAPLLIAAMAVVLMIRIGLEQAGLPYSQRINFQSWCCREKGNMNKARMTAELEQIPGKHLLFVKTKTNLDDIFQWIYNDADLDAARFVWARDLGAERNAELARSFARRQIWLVDPNAKPATRVEYSPERSELESPAPASPSGNAAAAAH